MTIKKQLQSMALDYWNNYLTIEKFAEHNEITTMQAVKLIALAKEIHESMVLDYKFIKSEAAFKTDTN